MKKNQLKVVAILMGLMLLAGCGDREKKAPQLNYMPTTESVISAQESSVAESVSEEADVAGAEAEAELYVLSFEAVTTEGESVTDACFADSKLTMINLWGTYCNPCLSEMPDLGEIAASYDKADFQLMGIICDVPEGADQKDIDNAKALIEKTGANYPHLLLSESLYINLVGGTDAVPTTFFVNSKGEVLGYVVGANSKETWVDLIEQLLAETEAAAQ